MPIPNTTRSSELEILRQFWLRDVGRRGASAFTIETYEQQTRVFLELTPQATTAKDLNRENLRAFLDTMETSGRFKKSSIRAYVRSVKCWWNWLLSEDYPVDPKIKYVKGPKLEDRAPETLSPAEIQMMVSACAKSRRGRRDALMLRTLFTTGLRLNEVTELKSKDISIQDNAVFAHIHGKGAKDRFVPFPEGLDQAILKWASQTPAEQRLFQVGKRAIYEQIKRIARRAGVQRNVHPHLFRHSFATAYLEQPGSDSMRLQRILGHGSSTMTRRYVHFKKGDLLDGPRVSDPTIKPKKAA